jgi:hypothetical protein
MVFLATGVFVATLLAIGWLFRCLGPDPRITLDHLRGESRDQVIQELGPPTNQAVDPVAGPVFLEYRGRPGVMGWFYAIRFSGGKVCEVRAVSSLLDK